MHTHIMQPSIPPKDPSTVFLGLIFGHNLCFPNNLPQKYAKVSVAQALINKIQIKVKYLKIGKYFIYG